MTDASQRIWFSLVSITVLCKWVATVFSIVTDNRAFFATIEYRNEGGPHSISGRSDLPSLPRLEKFGQGLMSDKLFEI
jgi:hypothetical protein